MIIWWTPRTAGGGSSVSPGVANVLLGVGFTINGVAFVGTYVPSIGPPPGPPVPNNDTSATGGYLLPVDE